MKNDRNKTKKKIIISAVFFGLIASVFGNNAIVGRASAWGPERTTYTNESPAPAAVFNSITNNGAVGDERDFVRIVEVHDDGTKDAYTSDIQVSGGKIYEVYIYYHNDASTTFNTKEYDYRGVARNTKVSASFPESLAKGQKGEVNAIISSTTTLVPEVWDEAYMTATEDVTFAYITGSAKIFNDWKANGSVLSTKLFSADGTYIGLNELNGLILGCDEFSGQVVFRIRASAVEQEEEPEPEPSKGEDRIWKAEIDKKVSKDGGETWLDEIDVVPGDELEFRVTYKNTGTMTQYNIIASDTMEGMSGMEYIRGTTKIVKDGLERILAETEDNETLGIFRSGATIIDKLEPGEEVAVYYSVRAKETEDAFTCGKTILNNLVGITAAKASENSSDSLTDSESDKTGNGQTTIYDKVAINVNRTNGCDPETLPNTGPAQIVLASVVGLGILTGCGYWIKSKNDLKKLQKQASGEKEI